MRQLGRNGSRALSAYYSDGLTPNTDTNTHPAAYANEFLRYYEAGRQGASKESVAPQNNAITPAQKAAAYFSGMNDAAEADAGTGGNNEAVQRHIQKAVTAQNKYIDKGVGGYTEGTGEKSAEVQELRNKLKSFSEFDDALAFVRSINNSAFDAENLTNLINDVDNLSFITAEKATIKSEIIQKSGFYKFDKVGTLADILGFTKIELCELKKPMTLHRRGYPGESTSRHGLGRWWGDQYRTIDQVRNELAVCEEWGNPLTGEYCITAPKGTKVIKGIAAPQTITDAAGNIIEYRPGGAVQYWLNDIPNEWIN